MIVNSEKYRQVLAEMAAKYYITKISLAAAEHARKQRNAKIVKLALVMTVPLACACLMLIIHLRYESFAARMTQTNKCQMLPDLGQRAHCLERSDFR